MKAAKTIISRFLQVCLFFMLIVPVTVIGCGEDAGEGINDVEVNERTLDEHLLSVKITDIKQVGEVIRYRIYLKQQGPGYISIPDMFKCLEQQGLKGEYDSYDSMNDYGAARQRCYGKGVSKDLDEAKEKAEQVLQCWMDNITEF